MVSVVLIVVWEFYDDDDYDADDDDDDDDVLLHGDSTARQMHARKIERSFNYINLDKAWVSIGWDVERSGHNNERVRHILSLNSYSET